MLSIVIPCYNESSGLFQLHSRLCAVLKNADISTEILYINDGSIDDTVDILNVLQSRDGRVGIIDLSRNFGKEVALTAGIDHARGDAIIVLDADLQDPPEYIPEMLENWRAGFDVVAMKRSDRSSDTFFKRVTAMWYYRILSGISPVRIPENVGDFRLISRRAADALKRLPERNRYMKGLFAWIGFSYVEIPYRRDPRYAGDTKLSFLKLLGLALDGITSFSISPLRIASAVGALIAIGALLFGVAMLTKTLLFGESVAGFPTLIVTMLFLGGTQLLAIGLLGEYVGRLLMESKQRPLYFLNSAALPNMEESSPVASNKWRKAAG
jgi:glycosyltransferase involved in cell wall biosynthesis